MEAATPSLSEGVRTLWKARSDGSREEELGSAIEGLKGRISDLSSQIADCNGRAEGIERGLPALRARYRKLAERFNDTRSRVEQALGRLREVPNTLSELAQDIARKLGKPLFDPDSLDYQMREVTRVAKALGRDRPHVPRPRPRRNSPRRTPGSRSSPESSHRSPSANRRSRPRRGGAAAAWP